MRDEQAHQCVGTERRRMERREWRVSGSGEGKKRKEEEKKEKVEER